MKKRSTKLSHCKKCGSKITISKYKYVLLCKSCKDNYKPLRIPVLPNNNKSRSIRIRLGDNRDNSSKTIFNPVKEVDPITLKEPKNLSNICQKCGKKTNYLERIKGIFICMDCTKDSHK